MFLVAKVFKTIHRVSLAVWALPATRERMPQQMHMTVLHDTLTVMETNANPLFIAHHSPGFT